MKPTSAKTPHANAYASTRYGDEPDTPRWVEWRLAIYPLALLCGALALALQEVWLRLSLLALFVALMAAPLLLKGMAWGGLGRLFRWLFLEKRLEVSREGWVFLGLTILFGVAAINTGTNLLYLVLSMLLSLIVVSGMMSEIDLKGLKLARGIPHQVFAGEPTRLKLQLINPRRWIPSYALQLAELEGPFGPDAQPRVGTKQFIARIGPGDHVTRVYTHTFERRGVYRLRGFLLTTRFPFGFFTKLARAELPSELVVLPPIWRLLPGALGGTGRDREAMRARARSFSPDEFRSLRPYRQGDNPRWIHWRSSARTGMLMVKEFEPRATDRAAVILDTAIGPAHGPAAAAEAAAAAARALDRGALLCASFVEHLARIGQRPLVAFPSGPDDGLVRFGEEGGARAGLALLDALARVTPVTDPGFARLVAAAGPALRAGARVYILSARDPAEVRHALRREDPTGTAIEVRGFRSQAELERWVQPERGARPPGGLAAGPRADPAPSNGKGTLDAHARRAPRAEAAAGERS